jgi:hypothetical protein
MTTGRHRTAVLFRTGALVLASAFSLGTPASIAASKHPVTSKSNSLTTQFPLRHQQLCCKTTSSRGPSGAGSTKTATTPSTTDPARSPSVSTSALASTAPLPASRSHPAHSAGGSAILAAGIGALLAAMILVAVISRRAGRSDPAARLVTFSSVSAQPARRYTETNTVGPRPSLPTEVVSEPAGRDSEEFSEPPAAAAYGGDAPTAHAFEEVREPIGRDGNLRDPANQYLDAVVELPEPSLDEVSEPAEHPVDDVGAPTARDGRTGVGTGLARRSERPQHRTGVLSSRHRSRRRPRAAHRRLRDVLHSYLQRKKSG